MKHREDLGAPLLELGNTLALPDLVGECDEDILDRGVIVRPRGVRLREPHAIRNDALLFEEPAPGRFMLVTPTNQLGRTDRLADVVRCGAE